MAVAAYDGSGWSAYVFVPEGGEWREGEPRRFPAVSCHDLPAELVAFAAEQGAGKLRALIPSDVRSVPMALPDDPDPEEIQAALAFELADEAGDEAWDLRVAAARADVYRMGGMPEEVLAATFEPARLERYAAACRAGGLSCDAVGSLELAVLALHAGAEPDSRCLLALESSCFYATPLAAMNPFGVQPLAARLTVEERDANPEKYERLKRRLGALGHVQAVVWTAGDMDAERREFVRSLLGEGDVSFRPLAGDLGRALLPAASARKPGGVAEPCALAARADKPRDPHRAGTWVAAVVLLGGMAAMGSVYFNLKADLADARQRLKAWETLEQERNALGKKSTALRDRRNDSQRRVRLLRETEPLPEGLMALLELLATGMPPYTRVTSIRQTPDGAIVIEGSSLYQNGLSGLIDEIGNAVRPYGLIVDTPGMRNGDRANELLFTYRVFRSGSTS